MKKDTSLFRGTQVVWYIVYILEALLAFRFLLKLLGANPGAGFTQFIYSVTAVPLAPFRFVFSNNAVAGSAIEWSTLLGMVVYYAVAVGIIKLFAISRDINDTEADIGLRSQDV